MNRQRHSHILLAALLLMAAVPQQHFAQTWPEASSEAKPGTRWWWLGSAVDKAGLEYNLSQYASHGIGAVEVTPLYGVQGNEANNLPFLSPEWFAAMRQTKEIADKYDIELDMATGTGWPFGGPWVPLEESACRVVFVRQNVADAKDGVLSLLPEERLRKNSVLCKVMMYDSQGTATDLTDKAPEGRLPLSGLNLQENEQVIALYVKYGVMKVKRAAPGGEGYVVDHFNHEAVAHYLDHISQAFIDNDTPFPHTFFNDSYEVDAADWTPNLLNDFFELRGYRLEDHLPELIDNDPKVLSDYRETLGDLILENFTKQWTSWAHSHGAITRNQAHGSPANLIDCYAAVDIPEIEGFGLTDFKIKGLRNDSAYTRKNDSDYSMYKYASSAAHVCGKPYTSSETFTWLTEHFRTSLSQLKPDLDLMFCAGVNHIFFHGSCYTPANDPWPGWKFYASIDMSPTNSIWRDAPFFMKYAERCQSFLQMGKPDNDFLVLLPIRDMWQKPIKKLLMQFTIHGMKNLAPEFIKTILDIDAAGFDCDYISERLLLSTTCEGGKLKTEGGSEYKALIIPGSATLPDALRAHIESLQQQGAKVLYTTDAATLSAVTKPEAMKLRAGLKAIRRKNDSGHHYFMANLTPDDIVTTVPLSVSYAAARWFNPMTGEVTDALTNDDGIEIRLRSGESMILQTYDSNHLPATTTPVSTATEQLGEIELNGRYTLSFIEEAPRVERTFKLKGAQTWEQLQDDSVKVTMGTGVYTTSFKTTKSQMQQAEKWLIDLGDVRESARVFINDCFVGCAWAAPFLLDCTGHIKKGRNDIRIEVTNLPANRIAWLDRNNIGWRKMEEINMVDIHYKKTTYDSWPPQPSGLNSTPRIVLLRSKK